jgi:D-alanyl-D-alanine carboxypeptidase
VTAGVADLATGRPPALADRYRVDLDAHRKPISLDRMLDLGLGGPPAFRPGERYAYCNTNFVVLERIVETVTGRALGDELRDRVLGPLGLRATSYPDADDLSLPAPAWHGYDDEDGSGWRDCTATCFGRGDGALIATAPDIARFLRALLGGALLPPALLQRMRTVLPDDPPAARDYGMGLIRERLPSDTTVWGHSGRGYGFVHSPFMDTGSGRVAVLVRNGTRGFRPRPSRPRPDFDPQVRAHAFRLPLDRLGELGQG